MPKLQYNLDDIKDFSVEPGKYRAKLTKVEQTLSKSKKPMLVFYWKILSGKAKGQEIRSYVSLAPNALSTLKEHLVALGFKGKVNLDTTRLIGKICVITVGLRAGTSKAGEDTEFANVVALAPDGTPTTSTPSKKKRREEEDEDDEEVEDEDGEDEEDDSEEDEDSDDEEESDDEDDEEDEDEDEDDEEEEPVRRKKSSKVAAPARRPAPAAKKPAPGKKKKPGGKLPF